MNDTYRIREAEDGELDLLHRWLLEQFEEGEVKPLSMIRRLIRSGCYRVRLLLDGRGIPRAYAMLLQHPETGDSLLDYFAVRPEDQDSGLGSLFLRMLREALDGHALYIESEDPDFAEDEKSREHMLRRVRFYRKNGCFDTGVRAEVFGFHYAIYALTDGAEADFEAPEKAFEGLYRFMLPREMYERNIRIRRIQGKL